MTGDGYVTPEFIQSCMDEASAGNGQPDNYVESSLDVLARALLHMPPRIQEALARTAGMSEDELAARVQALHPDEPMSDTLFGSGILEVADQLQHPQL